MAADDKEIVERCPAMLNHPTRARGIDPSHGLERVAKLRHSLPMLGFKVLVGHPKTYS
jgi:hypothetical protein